MREQQMRKLLEKLVILKGKGLQKSELVKDLSGFPIETLPL